MGNINPEADTYDFHWQPDENSYNQRIEDLKSEGQTFFVIYSFRGHSEGAETHWVICESREQMEHLPQSYDDWDDSYMPHELVLNVVNGEVVDTPPEWWEDYENKFNQSEQRRQWKDSGSSRYRL